ncbi:MAG: hypothetical protein B7Y36_11735 [Novosphingobium sp. 28-62-57]|uniref:hypothetical protein n=1 Tax=unclassified Novosphingobium TaxID=2644732 RepID=UPI000BD12D75|nr:MULTISPECIES: hypothetical protein [unclassified Novosphingobium]OYW50823.1 MAG: hypothetical protein B7Z34_03100 [Novosphingobium sp. 12-62-10]OYZ10039.1 MAG: hypothetical protein B7Y36_11735 [Novosphingobium sp. 28-62-57]
MKCQLVFRYDFSSDGDDFGWLAAQIDTPQFKAVNGTWVQWQDIEELTASLGRFPIEALEPVVGKWGFSEDGRDTEVTKIVIKPQGIASALSVHVLLANNYKPANLCSVQFVTDYPALAKFSGELRRMLQDRVGSAALDGWADDS